MVEAILLALIGGTAGIFLVYWGTSAPFLGRLGLVLPPHLDISPDGAVLAVSIALALATTLVFGLFPAIRFSKPDLVSSLKDHAGGGGRRVGRVHRIAASAQTGVALSLLIVCSLFLRALGLMERRDFGFEPSGLLVTRLDLSRDGNELFEGEEPFLNRVRASVGSIPGVSSVTVADGIPLDLVGNYARVSRADRTDDHGGRILVEFTRATEGFFETIGTPILLGRGFDPDDVSSSEPVAIITISLAERLWPGEDAVGRQVRFGVGRDSVKAHTVVGVVSHTASSRPTEDRPHLFVALRQNYQPRILVAARGSLGTSALVTPIRSAILDADPTLPIPNVVTSESLVDRSTAAQKVNAQAAAAFGILTLLLSAIGVYGVVAFSVARRTREIGLRMAMGATRQRVLVDVFGDGVRLAVPGLILGTLAAVGTAAAMGSFLLGLNPADPVSIGAAAGVLFLVVLLASMVPARRASGIDPMNALRCE
jgi:predicted permease